MVDYTQFLIRDCGPRQERRHDAVLVYVCENGEIDRGVLYLVRVTE